MKNPNRSRIFVVVILLIFSSLLYSQKEPVKFGKVSTEELEMKTYPKDSLVEAVVLTNYGYSEIKYNTDKGFYLQFTNLSRIKILTKDGLKHANVKIPLQVSGNGKEETLSSIKAQTYNLENGKVVISKLDKKDIYEEDINKYHKIRKFALPNVKAGSVIEYKYVITSNLFYLKPWFFQTTIPVIRSEYRTTIPDFFKFKTFLNDYIPPDINETSNSSMAHSNAGNYLVNRNRYVYKDLPAFRNEDFITTPLDYLAKIEFELLSANFPREGEKNFTLTWPQICNNLISSVNFGGQLTKHSFLSDIISGIDPSWSDEQKLNSAYEQLKKKMKWNGFYGIYINSTLSNAYKKGEGSTADINLMLVSLLKALKFEAYPVLLSTRSHGKINMLYPKQSSFNYVVVIAKLNDNYLLLDAVSDFTKPGELSFDCLNGDGLVVIKDMPKWIPLREGETFKKGISVVAKFTEDGLTAEMSRQSYSLTAQNLRNKIAGTGLKKYIDDYKNNQENWTIDDYKIENGLDPAKPVREKITISAFNNIDTEADMIYLPAILVEENIENPFTDEKRIYPVDFGAPKSTTYFLTMTIPEGYEPEELPESGLLKLPGNAGKFMYTSKSMNGMIQVYCQISITKTKFTPEEYELLRSFYGQIAEKLNEQIVLKKI